LLLGRVIIGDTEIRGAVVGEVGTLAFVGGGEWREGCTFDADLLEASGAKEVVVLPTAAAYEFPQRAIDQARAWFEGLGASVVGLPILQRRDTQLDEYIDAIRGARFIYLSDGSPLHLRSVVKDSPMWTAILDAWRAGATVVGSSAGGMIFGDPMVDPRGGAFTLGLGLVRHFALVPHWETWTDDKARRMTHLTPDDVVVAEIEERTALIRWSSGTWDVRGNGKATLTLKRTPIELDQIESAVDTARVPV
jgi:cyanophycinase